MKTFETKKAPAAIGPYSQAKMVGQFCIRIRPDSGRSGNRRSCWGYRSKLRLSSPAKTLEQSLKKLVLDLTML